MTANRTANSHSKGKRLARLAAILVLPVALLASQLASAAPLDLADEPLFLGNQVQPRIMLGISNNHQLYFKAYDDYSDLDGDGAPDTTYKNSIDYYGYFDSDKCYSYTGSRFEPESFTSDKYCDDGNGDWSGNFLNWASMSRIDIVRKILYGGKRSTDTSSETVLQRSYIPNDAHSFAKYYNESDLDKLTPFDSVSTGPPSDPTKANGNGITICNTTYVDGTKWSQDVTAPPLMRIAEGNYSLWNANERWQCQWDDEESALNDNDVTASGINAYDSNPNESNDGVNGGSGASDYIARVEVCVDESAGGGDDLIRDGDPSDANNDNNENCRQYPDGNFKPAGVMQTYGEDGSAQFGLITGSYKKNKSGGIVRKNIEDDLSDEINVNSDGTFKAAPSDGGIISALDALRIVDYNHNAGTYTDSSGDDCAYGMGSFSNGQCKNWGNPQSEMFLEALRYMAGESPTSAFTADDSTLLSDVKSPSWQDPIADSEKYCAPLNVLQFNTSSVSYDANELGGFSDIDTVGTTLDTVTNEIGSAENIHGNEFFLGDAGGAGPDRLCTAKTVGELAEVRGLCPNAARLEGSYQVAGLAHHAKTTDIRSDREDKQTVKTYGVNLQPSTYAIEIQVPGTDRTVELLPACRNREPDPDGNCSIVDFQVVEQDFSNGHARLYVNWEDSEQGGDFDQDMWGTITVNVDTAPATPELVVTTDVHAQSTPHKMGFGYVLNGVTEDGFHVHSGINDFDYTDPASGSPGCSDCNHGQKSGTLTEARYVIGDSGAQNLQDPLRLAAKWGGFEEAEGDSNGDPDQQSEWDQDGDGSPDTYFFAQDPRELESSLRAAFLGVTERESSASSVALNSQSFRGDSRLYQARFDTANWTGDLLAFELIEKRLDTKAGVQEEYTTIVPEDSPSWSAANKLDARDPDDREIITFKPSNRDGIPFEWPSSPASPGVDELDVDQSEALDKNPVTGSDDGSGEARLQFLRGDRSNEGNTPGDFRERDSVLGDLVNSAPTYVGTPAFFYPRTWPFGSEPDDSYSSFVQNNESRDAMVYVGGNDGMLHGFDAETGEERFAYVPDASFDKLNKLTDPDYNHDFYVDGSPTYVDAYVDGSWSSVLVGGLRGGGQGLYALDVTDPSQFNNAADPGNADDIVMWEFNDTDTSATGDPANGDSDLGFTYGKPSVVRLASGEWAAVFGNGYNSTASDDNKGSGNAVLYIVDLEDGSLIKKIDTKVGPGDDPTGNDRPNGLSSPAVADVDQDGVADFAYAGDLFGNLWKFDLTDGDASNTSSDLSSAAAPSDWQTVSPASSGGDPTPLFEAVNASGEAQAITVRPQIARHPDGKGGYMVYFGTGKYIETDDATPTDTPKNAFYGIWDNGSNKFDRSELLEQHILRESTVDPENDDLQDDPEDQTVRTTSANKINKWYDGSGPDQGKGGWYLDLDAPGSPDPTDPGTDRGEKAVTNPIVRNDRIIFTTLIPENSPCAFGGTGWIMELNASDGSRRDEPPFDLNQDGDFDGDDQTDNGNNASGIKRDAVVSQVAIMANDQQGGNETKLSSTSEGDVDSVEENSGDEDRGRQSWQELR